MDIKPFSLDVFLLLVLISCLADCKSDKKNHLENSYQAPTSEGYLKRKLSPFLKNCPDLKVLLINENICSFNKQLVLQTLTKPCNHSRVVLLVSSLHAATDVFLRKSMDIARTNNIPVVIDNKFGISEVYPVLPYARVFTFHHSKLEYEQYLKSEIL